MISVFIERKPDRRVIGREASKVYQVKSRDFDDPNSMTCATGSHRCLTHRIGIIVEVLIRRWPSITVVSCSRNSIVFLRLLRDKCWEMI